MLFIECEKQRAIEHIKKTQKKKQNKGRNLKNIFIYCESEKELAKRRSKNDDESG